MRKSELVEAVASQVNVSRSVAELIINATFNTIVDAVASGDKVILTGFGTFEARERSARTGRNPHTGEVMDIAASRTAAFSAGKLFSDAVKK